MQDVEQVWAVVTALNHCTSSGDAAATQKYPSGQLERLWKLLLLNQFHDVLPGSSIGMVIFCFKFICDTLQDYWCRLYWCTDHPLAWWAFVLNTFLWHYIYKDRHNPSKKALRDSWEDSSYFVNIFNKQNVVMSFKMWTWCTIVLYSSRFLKKIYKVALKEHWAIKKN